MRTEKQLAELDFDLPSDVRRLVFSDLARYDYYVEKGAEEDPYDGASLVMTSSFDEVAMSRTNAISRPTENIALDILNAKAGIAVAKQKVLHIDKGIDRAASLVSSAAYVKDLRADLKKHLIYGIPNESLKPNRIGRPRRSFAMYKRRALYFIAVELGYIRISPEIERAELAVSWKRGL